ncbi:hypothetical protein COS91_06555 [Candidatus Desantisbacteria bacterium CG07_land_8_20_14_0_80_39_15]|uniref:Uncharacterized protein n=1 Tax=Candidatus Desantisbacteria bacterium CG07_land_8_20_14_0_80_39_15 TaxID=1974549 RepID=A0A2M6ZF80_9BACT|nr:MAG: hypothetical protein COS91_06555 [Candidatus Desantisbacteria bacterium CG07_land_8_20_14_0_80_39_15]
MDFKTEEDRIKIENVLRVAYQFVPSVVKKILEREGFEVEEQGEGLELSYRVKGADDISAVFCLRNLFLEIATRDRDEEPLEFDEELSNFSFFMFKTAKVMETKLKLFVAILKNGPDMTPEEMKKIVPEGTRIRVAKFDKSKIGNMHDYMARMQN